MWLFKKATSSPSALPIDGPWSISQGQHDGRVMFVRTNIGYREFGSVPRYEHQVGIAVRLRNPEPSGLPSPEENGELGELEETICSSLEQEGECLLVAVITTSGMREFIFYTREPQRVQQRVERLRSHVTSHEIQMIVQLDPAWRIYARFVPHDSRRR